MGIFHRCYYIAGLFPAVRSGDGGEHLQAAANSIQVAERLTHAGCGASVYLLQSRVHPVQIIVLYEDRVR